MPLDVAPMMRMVLVRLGDRHHRLYWSSHHILLDGWSGYRILRDVMGFYRASALNRPRTRRPPGSHEAYLRWLQSRDRAR